MCGEELDRSLMVRRITALNGARCSRGNRLVDCSPCAPGGSSCLPARVGQRRVMALSRLRSSWLMRAEPVFWAA